jgi:hypothetical protein
MVELAAELELGRMMGAMRPGRLARGFRALLGLVYVLGSPTHVYLAVANTEAYRAFSEWAPPTSEISRSLWNWFLSNARYLALLIAAFELAVGLLILKGGGPTKVGLLGALGFHIVLAAMFGMWPYTVPMILLIGWMLRYDFDRAFRRPAPPGAPE